MKATLHATCNELKIYLKIEMMIDFLMVLIAGTNTNDYDLIEV